MDQFRGAEMRQKRHYGGYYYYGRKKRASPVKHDFGNSLVESELDIENPENGIEG